MASTKALIVVLIIAIGFPLLKMNFDSALAGDMDAYIPDSMNSDITIDTPINPEDNPADVDLAWYEYIVQFVKFIWSILWGTTSMIIQTLGYIISFRDGLTSAFSLLFFNIAFIIIAIDYIIPTIRGN
jgi:hypothetical protein